MLDAFKKFGDAAGGLLFKDDDSTAPPAPPKPAAGSFAASTPGRPTTGAISGPPLNEDMVAELRKVVTSKVSAFTTLEERSNVMADAIPDEIARTKAAFKLLAHEGRSASDIVKAIDRHLMDVDGEQARFAAAVNTSKQAAAGKIRTEIAALERGVTDDSALVERLRQQLTDAESRIGKNQQLITEKSAEAANLDSEFDAKALAFAAAADHVKASLNSRKNVLSSLLA